MPLKFSNKEMLNCLKRIINLNNRIYNKRFYSGLYSYNQISISKNNSVNHDERKIFCPKCIQQQCRSLSNNSSLSYYNSFFDFITSTKASQFVKDSLIQMHDATGLPWWCTIFLATTGLKLGFGVLPGIYQQYLLSKTVLCNFEVKKKSKELMDEVLKKAKIHKWTQSKAKLHLAVLTRREYMALVIKNNCHPMKNVIINFCQLPIWIIMSLTLRKMATDMSMVSSLISEYGVTALQLQVGGVFWSKNLLIPDETFILPALVSLLGLAIVEVNLLASGNNEKKFFIKVVTNFLRIFSLLSFLITMNVPSIVSLYWATSLAFGLTQNLILLSPKVKRICRIPKTPIELEKPYSHIGNRIKEKFGNLAAVLNSLVQKK